MKRFAALTLLVFSLGACASAPAPAPVAEPEPTREVAVEGGAIDPVEVCRVAPCGQTPSADESAECVKQMTEALSDPCLRQVIAMKDCAMAQVKCDAEGQPVEGEMSALEACAPVLQTFMACCEANAGSVVCQ